MKRINLIFTIFLALIVSSCLPEQTVRDPLPDAANITKNTNTTEEEGTVFGTEIAWLNSGISSLTATIDIDNQKSIYLIGDQVDNYLGNTTNYQKSYCVEFRYPETANTKPKRLRVKLTPGISNQFQRGTITRYFTVNLASEFGNDFCLQSSLEVVDGQTKTITYNDSNYDGIENTSDQSVVLKSSDICTNCINIFTSNDVIIYEYDESLSLLKRINTNDLSYPQLTLRIDANSNSSSGTSSCTDSDCIAQGYDCCLQGQCITEKEIKISGVNADPSGFALAEQLKFTDPNWYKDYPQFYYSCLERPPETGVTPEPADPVDPVGDANTRLTELLADYACVEELKANTLANPFHRNPINSAATYTACDISNSTATNYYQNVMIRLYQNCGCVEKTDLNTMVANCPAYTYDPIYEIDSLGNETENIVALNCLAPPVNLTPLPFQDLDVAVNSRSAPHRFFDSNNIEIDPTKSLPAGASGVQEGESFQYLDDYYIFPRNGSYNMNSILGQMSVQLNQARPALTIDVEFDKQYLLVTRSGFYQACPTCAKDSWFNNFSAYPYTTTGVGLRAVGFTTSRTTYGSNTSLGNYEDTIFGRACFVPPTMIPYSHLEVADNQAQRLARLKTQAALFANGYQRDWYGFNKGALIGSFDGVTWFAIGKGRIVKSTSNKLFLAINAPFADLASPTEHIVSVQEYDFTSTAARYDYDPAKEINDDGQNEAASCQEYHKCETDAHCVSKLGWEYVCADVTYQKTHWPDFAVEGAIEVANSKKSGAIIQFLKQGVLPPGSGNKRCVYRGAGAPCRRDYDNISDEGLRKNLTCAPNFYCASLTASNAFNSEVARFARPLNELVESKNHLYGQDANILGRPKHYITNGSNLGALPAEAIAALEDNLSETDPSGSGEFGICRPGKLLPGYLSLTESKNWKPTEQHRSQDTAYRTDYISQIAGCNSTLYTSLRYSSCPILDEDGNYIHTQDDFLNDNFTVPGISTPQTQEQVLTRYGFSQNACGLESLDETADIYSASTSDDLKPYSAFRLIEGSSLASSNTIVNETLAMDACLRKAGSYCHTDLDCSPNKLMADVIDLSPLSTFGNLAEKSYFEEYLVCGQVRPEPLAGSSDYNTFNIHNNRCCRPLGSDITMYTEDSPRATESIGITSSKYGSFNPNASDRYSRYSVLDSPVNKVTKLSSIIRPSANAEDNDNDKILDFDTNITNPNQWKTIYNTASRTCCGGNWVRKFEDGTNNWGVNRLTIDINNLKCLNYRSRLVHTTDASAYGLSSAQLSSGLRTFCRDTGLLVGGCAGVPLAEGFFDYTDSAIIKPRLNTVTNHMTYYSNKTIMDNPSNNYWRDHKGNNNTWVFSEFTFGNTSSTNGILDWSLYDNYQDTNSGAGITPTLALVTQLPPWITFDTIATGDTPPYADTDVQIFLRNPSNNNSPNTAGTTDPEDGEYMRCRVYAGAAVTGGITDSYDLVAPNACGEGTPVTPDGTQMNCCAFYDTNNRSLRVTFENADIVNNANFKQDDSWLKIKFKNPVGTLGWEMRKVGASAVTEPSLLPHRRSADPGSALYYLRKLAKLEYLGIPQMTYEPIYCNDVYQELVPGIFKDVAFGQKLKTVADFINHDRTFINPYADTPWETDTAPAPYNANALNQNVVATQELVQITPVFSDNKFKCCLELGTVTDATEPANQCCSGYKVNITGEVGKMKCALPAGTDLNVYFNKFVSSEGVSTTLEAPLTEDDFDPFTGEPDVTRADVRNKLFVLGEKFCETGQVRSGAAVALFNEPLYTAPSEANESAPSEAIYSILDSVNDNNIGGDDPFPMGNDSFQQGFRWNHHFYCDSGSN